MRYLVDTDWLIDAFGGTAMAVETLDRQGVQGLAVSIITVGEVYEGAFRFLDSEAALAVFRENLRKFAVLPLSDPIMETFARVRADLRR